MTIKIVAISDIHGQIPPDVPEADILLIGGDICPTNWGVCENEKIWTQRDWLFREFKNWLDRQKVKNTIAVWGNHDWIGEKAPDLIPRLNWTILEDSGTEVMGLRIWGSPWQQPFFDWAFNLHEKELAEKWEKIPNDTDILLLHGPPYGHCDKAPDIYDPNVWVHTGSPSLTKRISDLNLKLVVAGHIHCSRGISKIGNTIVANVAMVNERYKMVHSPMIFEI